MIFLFEWVGSVSGTYRFLGAISFIVYQPPVVILRSLYNMLYIYIWLS